jgi:hypothetical protein
MNTAVAVLAIVVALLTAIGVQDLQWRLERWDYYRHRED